MEEEKSMAMATVSKYKVSCTLGIIQFFVQILIDGGRVGWKKVGVRLLSKK